MALYAWEILHHPKARVVRYLVSGGTATVVNFAVLYSFTEFLHVWYIISSIVAMGAGFITSFILQKFWTFSNTSLERVPVQFQLHVLLGLSNVAVNTLVLFILVEHFHVWYMVAQFISGAGLAVINYTVYRLFIFHK